MTNILVTGTGGGGVGEGVYKSLALTNKYNLYSCNSSANSLFLYDNPKHSFIVPNATDTAYCEVLLNICSQNNIKALIPGSEPELIVLSKNVKKFQAIGVIILANSESIITIFDNKWSTFLKLKELGINTPDSTLNIDDSSFFSRNEFPFVIKPIVGNASKNVFIANTTPELKCIVEYMSLKKIPFIIQEFIGNLNEEYTISVLSSLNGNYIGSIVLRRMLAGGYSQYIESHEFNELEDDAIRIAALVDSRGPLNLQCRLVDNRLSVFEINPRFSGTTPFRALLGFNEPDVILENELFKQNFFDKSLLKYDHFGVRGFIEKIYPNHLKNDISSY